MTNISPTIFKGYDIRAIYPDELNEENIVPIIHAIYKFLKTSDIVVGTDMRISSTILTKVAIETLVGLGARVVDIGIVSTPTFYFAVHYYKHAAGIQITASHNPKEYNGIKIVKNSPNGLIKIGKPTGLEEIKTITLQGETLEPQPGGTVIKKEGILLDEVENALKIAGNPQIKKFRIVADAANAMGSQYIEALFSKVPVDLIKMNFELDGTFPVHQPDPLQKETLVDLQKRVIAEGADLGLAPDGDGDRLFFIDEKGEIVPPTAITAIVAHDLLKTHPGESFLVDIRYILTPKKIIEENGGKIGITKVGHAYITEDMSKTNAIFAGESSGHYYFKETGNAESQMPVILTILKVLAESGKSFSQIVADYRRSFESGEVNFKVENASEILEMVKNKYQDGQLDELDGVAINYPGWRLSLRTSNTEPLMRLNVEAYNKEVLDQHFPEIVELIKQNGK
ncbi:phosphomannomutase/phosphoglucomutase [Candidatus Microgenomates bacterium]|nr:phosphomannomutase/phosphoglucomutase [Candidatus Microgenomates bacterium]